MMQPPAHAVLGWIVVGAGSLVTVWTIAIALYWMVRPGETDPDHPKRLILRNDR
ncbi:MAG: hypothetical protein M3Y21_07275 [Candidatus Eremiobacteraeota bacterium]|nr:hypothetical protein [Candidatus Eremiobacteraeota bacterium]